MTTPYATRRRALARELAEMPAPPPPADLLAALRAEIPADLAPANDARPRRTPGSNWLRLAASLAVVAVGLTIALRIVSDHDSGREETRQLSTDETQELPMKEKTAALSGVAAETRPVVAPAATGADPASAAVDAFAPVDSSARRRVQEEAGAELAESRPTTTAPERARRADEALAANAAPAAATAAADELDDRVAEGRDWRGSAKLQTEPSLEASSAPQGGTSMRGASPRVEALESGAAAPREAPLRALGYIGGVEAEAGSRVKERRTQTAPPPPTADAMFFRDAGTSGGVDTAEDRLSTFALDVDTGSWTLAREYLSRDGLPPAAAIRTEEFVNAQVYDDPAPRRGELTLVAEGAPSPFTPGDDWRLLRFAVKARELSAAARRPANLTFVVDVSGSMDRENRLGLVKRSLGLLLAELGADDRVALVVYGTRGRVLLRPTRDLEAIREAIAALRPEGSTNAEEGLRLGYDVAGEMYRAGVSNRVILCSDGVANVGATGPESILARIGREARRGIELTTVGVGMGNYNDGLMEQLADQGDGRYHYVDTLEEARRIFVDELAGTLETIAKDAKAQIEFDPAVVERWRLLGYDNRDVADRDFRNDRVDAGELGAGHAATALYEIRLAPGARARDTVATLRLRWKSVVTGEVDEAALTLRVRDLDASFRSASPNLRRAALAAELAERLKGTRHAERTSWETLAREAHRLADERRGDANLRELVDTIDRAAELAGAVAFEDWDDDREPREDD